MLSFETLQLSSLDFFFFLNERSWLLEAACISIFQIIYEALRNKKNGHFPRIDWNKTALLAADFSVSELSSLK